ncbi:MAG TPA: tyrosine-type recombinase/integrase [Chloroflexota bacterium]|nr:tyrosine-type recombinase/integrase [Chloroflexota bacterium]
MRDEAGIAAQVTRPRFRHTLGTRLINQVVPQHMIQRLLGHATRQMTARYTNLHDATVLPAFNDYCQRRVNLASEVIGYHPAGATDSSTPVESRRRAGPARRASEGVVPHSNA